MGKIDREFYDNHGALLGAPKGGQIGLIHGFNPSLTTYYLHLFEKASPVDGDRPRKRILVPGGSNFSYSASAFALGWTPTCTFVVSSTAEVLTTAAQVFSVSIEGNES